MYSISSTDDFNFYTVNFPDGSSRTFTDFKSFDAFCDYLQQRADFIAYLASLILYPTSLSVSISSILGVSPLPVLRPF